MCGLCGWIDQAPISQDILERMLLELRHRGPDVQRVEVVSGAGFGHARLSVIDLAEEANQPMWNERRTLCLVYNGEFYDFESQRAKLLRSGSRFISNSDTEVILRLYEEAGESCLKDIDGMFAFAIWDLRAKKLFAARDRIGIKPFYYYVSGSTFIFASEIKAILRNPCVSREICQTALAAYFCLGYIPKDLCIFKKIRKLPPAHCLTFQENKLSVRRYWSLPVPSGDTCMIKESDAFEQLEELLDQSVKRHLVSDVPLGVFLSGGVDSSLITAIASRHSPEPLKTFSIGFDNKPYNELPYARLVANHFGTSHHEHIAVIEEDVILQRLIHHFDEPFADSSAIPMYYVSRMAKESVTVALSGDGGDELFGGYNWYSWVLRVIAGQQLPMLIRKVVNSLDQYLPRSYYGKHFVKSLALSEFEIFKERVSVFQDHELETLAHVNDQSVFKKAFEKDYFANGESALERMSRTDFSYYLPDDILTKVDRASMAVGLEARVPLLDHRICEFAFSLPDSLKIHQGAKKYLLRKLGKKILPRKLDLKRKHGFTVPLGDWMKGKLGNHLFEILEQVHRDDVPNREAIKQMLTIHRSGHVDYGKQLWSILVYLLWQDKYL